VIAAAKAEPAKSVSRMPASAIPSILRVCCFSRRPASSSTRSLSWRGAGDPGSRCRRRAADVRRLCDRALAHRSRHAQGARRCGSDRTCRIARRAPVAATRARRLRSLAVAGVRCAAKTPAEIISKLHDTYVAAVNDPWCAEADRCGAERCRAHRRNSPTIAPRAAKWSEVVSGGHRAGLINFHTFASD